MDDKLTESRERYGRQHLPRFFSGGADDKQAAIRERYLGIGIAFGAGFGLLIGAGLGVAFDNLGLGIGVGICLGTGLGIVVGSSLGNKDASAVQDPSDAGGGRNI